MNRLDREDTSRQEAALREARDQLGDLLDNLAREARTAAKAAYSKRGLPDVDEVTAAFRKVERAREALDIATYDLQEAREE